MADLVAAEALLGELIAHPTVSSDSNLAMIEALADRLEDAGARVEVLHAPEGGKANLFATLGPEAGPEGGEGPEGLEGRGGLVLSGHTDVVPVTDQDWSCDPFAMTVRGDLLLGRGSCDMKGFIAAAVAMAPALAALPLRRPLHFAFTHDEEVGCIGARALCADLAARGIRPAMVVIGEPTGMEVIEGHKGCCEYRVTWRGRAGHGSRPDLGVNAARYAADYAVRLMALQGALAARAPAGCPFTPPHTTVNLGRISAGHTTNVIPDHAEVEWEMRPVAEADADFVREEMARLIAAQRDEMRRLAPEAGIEVEVLGEVAGLVPMARNAAREAVAALTGNRPAGLVSFGTEAGLFQALGSDVVVCGPGHIAQAHRPDEYLERAQLARCLEMIAGLGRRLC